MTATATARATRTATPAVKRKAVKTLPTHRIDADPTQPRTAFDPVKLNELAESMRALGQLQPVTVRYNRSTRRYVIVMGERRWRAAQMAGITEMTAVVLHGVADGARETLAQAVAENVGRADMSPLEEARSFQRLLHAGYTTDEVAQMVGKSASFIGWRIDLLGLCAPAQEALGKSHLPVGLARLMAALSCENQVQCLAKYAKGTFASDRDAEAYVRATRAEEDRRASQGSFFVLACDSTPTLTGRQDSLITAHDVTPQERDRIMTDRQRLTHRVDRLSTAGETLSELASTDPKELALLLASTPGGIVGYQQRIEHLDALARKAVANLRAAQAIAAVRSAAIRINPDATSH